MTAKTKTPAAAAPDATANLGPLGTIRKVGNLLASQGWAVRILLDETTATARQLVARVPMQLNAAERCELYLALTTWRHADGIGELVRPLPLGVRGDGARVAELLTAAGLSAHWTGDEGDGAIILLPRATSATAAQVDQAISNLRGIVALNDNPHIDEIARVTADLLAGIEQPAPAAEPPAGTPAAEQVAEVSPFHAHVLAKQAEAAAATKKPGRPKKTASAKAQEPQVATSTLPVTPDDESAPAEKRLRGRPKAAKVEATPITA